MVEINLKGSTNLSQLIIDDILTMIRQNELKPGDKMLSQRKLVVKYKVGRNVVREALQGLHMCNIVKTIPGKGTYISNMSLGSIINPAKIHFYSMGKKNVFQDLINVRIVLEAYAIGEAIKKVNENDIQNLEKLIKNMKLFIDERLDLFIEEDAKYHSYIVNITGNEVLISIMNLIENLVLREVAINNDKELSSLALIQHIKMLEKIKEKDIEGAKEVVLEHWERHKNRIVEAIYNFKK